MTEDMMNPMICSSALEEDGTLDRSKWDGAHVWDDTDPENIVCAECGSGYDSSVHIRKDSFEMISLSREDFASQGFDASKLTDDVMERLARKMSEGLMDDFWIVLDVHAKDLELEEIEETED